MRRTSTARGCVGYYRVPVALSRCSLLGRMAAWCKSRNPDEHPVSDTSALAKMHVAVRMRYGPDEPLKYLPSLGSEKTFYRWRDWAIERGSVVKAGKKFYFSAEELSRGVEMAA